MSFQLYYMVLIFLIVIIILYGMNVLQLISSMDSKFSISKGRFGIFVFLLEVSFIMTVFIRIPLCVLYLLIYLNFCLILFPVKEKRMSGWFIINMGTLFFGIIHLTVLGGMALVKDISVYEVIKGTDTYLFSLLFTIIIILLGGILLYAPYVREKLGILNQREEEFHILIYFSWFGIGYILFDSIPTMFRLPYDLISWFLIGSSMLFLLQVIVFLDHIYIIAKSAYLEEEYYSLENKRGEQGEKVKKLRKIAYIDSLTNVYTRCYVVEYIQVLLNGKISFVLVYIDLDHLKHINDTYGHLAGDQYLIDFSNIFSKSLGNNSILARIGGDEFLVIMTEYTKQQAERKIEGIRIMMEKEKRQDEPLAFSFGAINVLPECRKGIKELIDLADTAMYRDKKRRREEGK